MAPVPEDNQEKPPPKDEDLSTFSNTNLVPAMIGSESSDENDDDYPDTSGYTLLPQEPEEDDDNNYNDVANYLASYSYNAMNDNSATASDRQHDSVTSDGASVISDNLPDEVIRSEAASSAPTVDASKTSLHPEFLAKYPDGKVPSYVQLPDIPANSSKDLLWNKKRSEKSVPPLDSAQENKIVKAMSGFSLPTENIPDWARTMSSDDWDRVISHQIQPVPKKSDTCENQQKADTSLEQKTQSQPGWVAEFPDP